MILRDLLFFSLHVGVFTSGINYKVDPYDLRATKALIFEHCKEDYKTILIEDTTKQLRPTWFQQLHKQCYSGIIKDENFLGTRKIDAILIGIMTSSKLKNAFNKMQTTKWWNVMIPVYILHLTENDCEWALDILWESWNREVLTSYFLCIEKDDVQVYTYNPFTSRAPGNWAEVQSSSMESKWTLYRRKYHPKTICQGLDFDRTEYLDSYQINVLIPAPIKRDESIVENFTTSSDLNQWYQNLSNHYGEIMPTGSLFITDALMRTFNVDLSIRLNQEGLIEDTYLMILNKSVEALRKKAPLHLVLINEFAEEIESRLRSLNISDTKIQSFTQNYPFSWEQYAIASYNRGYRTLADKIWNFYGIWTILFTVIILMVTFTVIWFTESKKTAFAVFETIRLLINHGLHTRMNTLPLRIFFITILIYFLIVQATFHGHLAKFLTKPELRKHPETKDDLTKMSNTSVYDRKHVQEELINTTVKNPLYKYIVNTCVNYMLHKNTSVVCVFDYEELQKLSKKHKKLYVSKKPFVVEYKRFFIKNHWPLLNHVNRFFISLNDLGFRQLQSDKQLVERVMHNLTVAEARSNEKFHPIKLDNLMFSFVILAVGLICATLSFCVEVVISQYSKWNVIPRIKNFKNKTLKLMNRIYVLCKYRR